jgi:hypothetical protein
VNHDSSHEVSRETIKWMWVIWPSFLMAGVLEVLVFAVVDPSELAMAHEPMQWSVRAIYSVSFFTFWLATFCSSIVTAWLSSAKLK